VKIRIVKAGGAVVELSEVAGVEIVECGKLAIARHPVFGGQGMQMKLDGPNDGMGFYDPNVEWPLSPVVIG
jgi:hypothetical protein